LSLQIFEYEDRFRVDRRKLEMLMMGCFPPVQEPAADFFGRIEEDTGTVVIWPSRLKIGAKSKKGKFKFLPDVLPSLHAFHRQSIPISQLLPFKSITDR
jgi:hypothetical protein